MPNKENSSTQSSSDPSHSFFVHHSDQPGHLLIPIKLNGANYQSWSKAMIHQSSKSRNMSVASYYIKLKMLWDELDTYHNPFTCN
uniref:Retrotransposon Copia-like N-terminal domain-containing protein n=1 Tax=Gossypium raimondii TaxID=29730 RepID=A0A0D2RWL3_GOSRA|nr:hypothetical protein B456_012G026000 [Gossypium raimondii]